MRNLYYKESQMVECGIESLKEWALEGDSKLPFFFGAALDELERILR